MATRHEVQVAQAGKPPRVIAVEKKVFVDPQIGIAAAEENAAVDYGSVRVIRHQRVVVQHGGKFKLYLIG